MCIVTDVLSSHVKQMLSGGFFGEDAVTRQASVVVADDASTVKADDSPGHSRTPSGGGPLKRFSSRRKSHDPHHVYAVAASAAAAIGKRKSETKLSQTTSPVQRTGSPSPRREDPSPHRPLTHKRTTSKEREKPSTLFSSLTALSDRVSSCMPSLYVEVGDSLGARLFQTDL